MMDKKSAARVHSKDIRGLPDIRIFSLKVCINVPPRDNLISLLRSKAAKLFDVIEGVVMLLGKNNFALMKRTQESYLVVFK